MFENFIDLAFEIFFCLLLAFLLGLLLGWLIWGRRKEDEVNVEGYERTIKNHEEQIASLRKKLAHCESDLADCKSSNIHLDDDMDYGVPANFVLPSSIPTATYAERDDLKLIKGVGPFLEKKLHAFGIYTFRQVAAMTPSVIEELGDTFGSFSDRIEREEWVDQAKTLHKEHHNETL